MRRSDCILPLLMLMERSAFHVTLKPSASAMARTGAIVQPFTEIVCTGMVLPLTTIFICACWLCAFGAGAITIGSSFTAIAGAAIVPATASAIIIEIVFFIKIVLSLFACFCRSLLIQSGTAKCCSLFKNFSAAALFAVLPYIQSADRKCCRKNKNFSVPYATFLLY